jgi:hypothetical protein
MLSWPSAPYRLGFFFIAASLSPTLAFAQFSNLDDLASQITKELKSLKPHLVAIADFRPPYGSTMPQAHHFARILSSYLEERARSKFAVANHSEFDNDLARLNIPPSDLAPGETVRSAARHLTADVLLIGTIEKRDNSYVLQVTPIHFPDGNSLPRLTATVALTRFLESFVTPLPSDVRGLSQKQSFRRL